MAFSFVESSPHNNSSVFQNAAETLKVLLLSVGLISTLLMVKGALMPFSCEIVFSNLVGFWNSIRCLFSSSLYICIIINSMVLLIAASSTLHRHETDNHNPPPPPPPAATLLSRSEKCSTSSLHRDSDHDHDHHHHHDYSHVLHYSTPQKCVGKSHLSSPDEIKKTADSLYASPDLSKKMEAEVSNNQLEYEKEDDTMEATWKAINGAKTKQLKKSETFKPRSSLHSENQLPPSTTSIWKDLRKSETFNEAVSIRRIGGLRRDPSIGIDEFNQKVEAFIKKFNESMKLQRQESDQRFSDMINRGL